MESASSRGVAAIAFSTRTHKCSCGCELQRDVNAEVNISKYFKSCQARGGHPQSNATGVGISTLVGENLLQQILT